MCPVNNQISQPYQAKPSYFHITNLFEFIQLSLELADIKSRLDVMFDNVKNNKTDIEFGYKMNKLDNRYRTLSKQHKELEKSLLSMSFYGEFLVKFDDRTYYRFLITESTVHFKEETILIDFTVDLPF